MANNLKSFVMGVCYKSRVDYLKSIGKIAVTKTFTEKNMIGEDRIRNYIKIKDNK